MSWYRTDWLRILAISIAYLGYVASLGSDWWISNEMWAEASTDFYHHASSALADSLFIPHAGYIAAPQRFLAFFIHELGYQPSETTYLYNLLGVLIGAFFALSINLNIFRPVIDSDLIRFLLSIATLGLIGFAERQFINFTYLSFFIILNLALLSCSKGNTRFSYLYMILPVVILSKPSMLILFPLCILAFVYAKNFYIKILWISCLCLSLIQTLFLFKARMTDGIFVPESEVSLISIVRTSLLYFFYYLEGAVLGKVPQHLILNLDYARAMLYASLLFIFIYKKPLRAKGFSQHHFYLFIMLFIAAASCTFYAITIPDIWNEVILTRMRSIDVNRYSIVLIGSLFYAVAFLIQSLKLSKALSSIIFSCWFLVGGWPAYFAYKDLNNNGQGFFPLTEASLWGAFIDDLNLHHCIPVNPLGWVYGSGCGVLTPYVHSGSIVSPVTTDEKKWHFPESYDQYTVDGFGVFVGGKGRFSADVAGHVMLNSSFSDPITLSPIEVHGETISFFYFIMPSHLKDKKIDGLVVSPRASDSWIAHFERFDAWGEILVIGRRN